MDLYALLDSEPHCCRQCLSLYGLEFETVAFGGLCTASPLLHWAPPRCCRKGWCWQVAVHRPAGLPVQTGLLTALLCPFLAWRGPTLGAGVTRCDAARHLGGCHTRDPGDFHWASRQGRRVVVFEKQIIVKVTMTCYMTCCSMLLCRRSLPECGLVYMCTLCTLIAQCAKVVQPHPTPNHSDSGQVKLIEPAIIHKLSVAPHNETEWRKLID